MIATFDIETNNLYYGATTIHCISVKLGDGATKVYTSRPMQGSSGTVVEGIEALYGHTIVGHNIVNFDIHVIKKLYDIDLYQHCEVLDTLIISKLKYTSLFITDANRKSIPPNLKGKHSLEAWGYRLNFYKGAYGKQVNAWDKLTPEMMDYCKQDVELNYKLYKRFEEKGLPPMEAINIEQKFAHIIARQEHYGWLFDVKKAQDLHIELMEDKEEAYKELVSVFKPLPTWFPVNYPKIPYKKDGSKSQVLLNQEARGCHFNDDMEWGYWEDVEFNPSSGDHIVRWIEHLYGKQKWKLTAPTKTKPEGSPKTGAEDLEDMFSNHSWATPLLKYLIINKLLGQLATGKKAWLTSVKSDGRLHGSVDTLGAVTRRCTHNNPNLAQVPSVGEKGNLSPELKKFKSELGHRCRKLFIVGEGKKLVGCDADALELRTLSHYMAKYDGGEYGRAVDSGKKEEGTDVHTLNTKKAGLASRDDGKTFIYAFLYGAGDEKIGKIVGKGKAHGKKLKDTFLTQLPALKQLITGVQTAVEEKGFIKAIDGNPFFVRSSHSALNTLLQGAGAMVMKYWIVEADEQLSKVYTNSWTSTTPQYEWVGNIHDEAQAEVDEDIAREVARIEEEAFLSITKKLKYRVPLKGTADVGSSWADTH